MCYPVLNRGNGQSEVFRKDADFTAFLELPIVSVLAPGYSATTLIVVVPTFAPLQRNQRRISVLVSFVIGLSLGFLVTLLSIGLSRWPIRAAKLVAGSAAGAAGAVTYAQLLVPVSKPIVAGRCEAGCPRVPGS
jgi:hypothetical protein